MGTTDRSGLMNETMKKIVDGTISHYLKDKVDSMTNNEKIILTLSIMLQKEYNYSKESINVVTNLMLGTYDESDIKFINDLIEENL